MTYEISDIPVDIAIRSADWEVRLFLLGARFRALIVGSDFHARSNVSQLGASPAKEKGTRDESRNPSLCSCLLLVSD